MGGYHSFYGGSNYGLGSKYSDYGSNGPIAPDIPFSSFATATDARTAAQLRSVTERLNQGTKTIEVSMLFPQVEESIPDQHLDEIYRLKKLVGADLTLHGPLVEPTGFNQEAGAWDESMREQAERTMWSALKRGNKISPEGNLVVTFHSSNGLPPPDVKMIDDKTGKEVTHRISVINYRTGKLMTLPAPREEHLIEQTQKQLENPAQAELDRINRDNWEQPLSQITHELGRANELFEAAIEGKKYLSDLKDGKMQDTKAVMEKYHLYKNEPEKFNKMIQDQAEDSGLPEEIYKQQVDYVNRGDIIVRNAFREFRDIYNQAYEAVNNGSYKDENDKKADLEKLDEIKIRIKEQVHSGQDYIKDYKKLKDFASNVIQSVEDLNNLKKAPELYKPLRDFGIDKSAETFGNLAFNSYKEFDKGKTAPIISIENPPHGSGLSTAEDLRDLIEASRKKLVNNLVEKEGLSKSKAEDYAKKAIGATWDVGHINMLKKYGYDDTHLSEQTKKIAPFVNKIHLSDNFGLEHTELPMGMGNVPMQKHIAELKKAHGDKLKEIKQIIEAGNWYEPFRNVPLHETLSAYGTPISGAGMGGWNQYGNTMGGYFAGTGYNPEVHHSVYGAGFTTLPAELGGQMQGRSRFSGAPIE